MASIPNYEHFTTKSLSFDRISEETATLFAANYQLAPPQSLSSKLVYINHIIAHDYPNASIEQQQSQQQQSQQQPQPPLLGPVNQVNTISTTIPHAASSLIDITNDNTLTLTTSSDPLDLSHLLAPATLDTIDDGPNGAAPPPSDYVSHQVLKSHQGWVTTIDIDPSNKLFASSGEDCTIQIWDMETSRRQYTFTGHTLPVTSVKFSPHNTRLFSTSDDRELKMWDLERNVFISNFHGHTKAVNVVDIHPVHDLVITGGHDRTCKIWDVRTKHCVRTLEGHRGAITSIVTSPTDPQVITGSMDTTIRLWDIISGRTIATHAHHKKSIRRIITHPEQHTLISASSDSVKKWRLPILSPEPHELEQQWVNQYNSLKSSQYPAHNTMNASDLGYMFDYENTNNISKSRTSTLTQQQQQLGVLTNSIAVDGNTLACGLSSGVINLYNYSTGKLHNQIKVPVAPGSLQSESTIYDLKFDLTGKYLFAGCADKTVKIFKRVERGD